MEKGNRPLVMTQVDIKPEPNWMRKFSIYVIIVFGLMCVISLIQFSLVYCAYTRFAPQKDKAHADTKTSEDTKTSDDAKATEDAKSNPPSSNEQGTDGKSFLDALGVSGDFFGMQTALFSALAFAGLIVTLLMQHHELSQQREVQKTSVATLQLQVMEFEENRAVMIEQKQELTSQRQAMQQQLFESTLFELVNIFFKCRQDVTYGNHSNGESAVQRNFRSIVEAIEKCEIESRSQNRGIEAFLSERVVSFETTSRNHQTYLDSYFSLWLYFKESSFNQEPKYHTILWSILTPFEKKLFAIASLWNKEFHEAIRDVAVKVIPHLDQVKKIVEERTTA